VNVNYWAAIMGMGVVAGMMGIFLFVMFVFYFPWQDRRQARWEAEERAEAEAAAQAQVGAASPAVQ